MLLEKPLLDQQVEAGLRGDFKRGWELAEELARLSPACNRAKFNRAWYEMMRGDLLKGLQLLDAGRWERAFGDRPLPTDKPIWKDQDLRDKHLLLCAEGGYGDEIINVRFARDFAARGARVIATCDPSLSSVFARIPGVAAVVNHKAAPEVFHDYWVPAMSAARVLEHTYGTLSGEPYLSVDPDHRAKWSTYFERRFQGAPRARIGLRFYGNPKFEHEQHRRFPVQGLIDAIEGRPFVNLQKEETDLPMETWEDTLAIIDQLDLVITSCTSVAHASAALGKETWVIVPILPYYIWALPGDRSPWYRSVRLFRQGKFGEWQDVFEAIQTSLKERMPGN
ncbi:MAG: hypothetical protein NDJ90_15655 [Oligoflexia bacterium]|nr:hypothetical protein [Oligoflexia bacterium]